MTVDELLTALEEDPENRGVLAMLADELRRQHDPRGELIAAQLAGDDAGRDALLSKLALPVTLGMYDRVTWGIGFVRKLVVLAKNKDRILELEPLWRDPSMRVLSELVVAFKTGRGSYAAKLLARELPPSIRTLQLGRRDEVYIEDAEDIHVLEIASKIAPTLPRLRMLVLEGPLLVATDKNIEALVSGRLRMLKHPQLETLALGALTDGDLQCAVDAIAVSDLPALCRLEIRTKFSGGSIDRVCTSLATRGWLARITHLALRDVTLGDAGIAALVEGIGDRKLAQLDMTGVKLLPAQSERLAAACDELIAPDVIAPVGDTSETWLVHDNKPEWGRGRVVRRFGDKIEVDFEHAGPKVFMANARFLRTAS